MLKILVAVAASALFAVPALQPDAYPVGRIRTDKGEILFYLYPQTPNHQASFITLANTHYFDSLTFNRVIKNFVAQGGCPDTPEGFAGSPYNLVPEFNDSLRHVYGAVGAGRDDNPQKLSAGCQLYIVANKNGLPRLDGNYTVYGQVIKGMDVVESIVSVPTDTLDAPLVPIKLRVDIVDMSSSQLAGYGIKVE